MDVWWKMVLYEDSINSSVVHLLKFGGEIFDQKGRILQN